MGYQPNINCVFFHKERNCYNKKVKRSFFGLGPKYCMERVDNCECPHKELYTNQQEEDRK